MAELKQYLESQFTKLDQKFTEVAGQLSYNGKAMASLQQELSTMASRQVVAETTIREQGVTIQQQGGAIQHQGSTIQQQRVSIQGQGDTLAKHGEQLGSQGDQIHQMRDDILYIYLSNSKMNHIVTQHKTF